MFFFSNEKQECKQQKRSDTADAGKKIPSAELKAKESPFQFVHFIPGRTCSSIPI